MKMIFAVFWLVATARIAFATEILEFSSTSGTYAPGDSFGFNVTLIFSGYNALGYDYKLETQEALAPFLFITGFSYGTTFTDPIQPPSLPQGFNIPEFYNVYAPNGWFTHESDLGALTPTNEEYALPGSYLVARMMFTISDLALPGVYSLQTTTLAPAPSGVVDKDFNYHFITTPARYTLTITGSQTVPESGPGLIGAGALLGLLLIQSSLAHKECSKQDRPQQSK